MTPVIILGIVVVAAPLPKERPKPPPSVVGEWVLVNATFDGVEEKFVDGPRRFVFDADGTYTVFRGGRKQYEHEYGTNPKTDPAGMDLERVLSGERGTHEAIYKVAGDTLTICWAIRQTPRPTKFESTADSKTVLWVFQRVKRE
jgi:uncharacterized protein (TIGR03067 family)